MSSRQQGGKLAGRSGAARWRRHPARSANHVGRGGTFRQPARSRCPRESALLGPHDQLSLWLVPIGTGAVLARQRVVTTASAPSSIRVAHSIALLASAFATDADWY